MDEAELETIEKNNHQAFLLSETFPDLKRRLAFARKVKRLLPSEFWKDGVAFYLDGVSWAHKTNPCEQARSSRTRTWRQKGEGLSIHCTAKGRKEGSGGSMVKLMVEIACDKGVIKCQQYYGNINEEMFSNFIKKEFPENLVQWKACPNFVLFRIFARG